LLPPVFRKDFAGCSEVNSRESKCRPWSISLNKRRKGEVRKLKSLLWDELSLKWHLRA